MAVWLRISNLVISLVPLVQFNFRKYSLNQICNSYHCCIESSPIQNKIPLRLRMHEEIRLIHLNNLKPYRKPNSIRCNVHCHIDIQKKIRINIYNLFVTSKNEFSNSPIHEFKVLHISQRAFYNPFIMLFRINKNQVVLIYYFKKTF